MDKQQKVPELREALAWLRNCKVEDNLVKSMKRKADVLDAVLVAIERLLPEYCGVCKSNYMVEREFSPKLEFSGCQQGFHEECLEATLGVNTLGVNTLGLVRIFNNHLV